MRRRVNVTLPEETIGLIDRLVGRGNRSRFLDASVKHYVRAASRRKLNRALREGYARWADEDRRLAEEWFALEEEAWCRLDR